MKNCKISACLIPVAAAAIFLMLYNWLTHGWLLMGDYAATASLWRPQAEMEEMCPLWLAYYIVLAAVVTCWFKKTKCALACATKPGEKPTRCPIKSGGCCFGLKLGLLIGLMMASSYLYMPIPVSLAVKWFFTGFFEGLGIGIILGMTCKTSSACATDKGSATGNL